MEKLRRRLGDLIAQLVESRHLDRSLLMARLDGAFVVACKAFHNLEVFERLQIRYRTNELYTQKKFNMLREEAEGYSKLLWEFHSYANGTDGFNESSMVEMMRSLIGYFFLDPNRVLDLLLDVLELHVDSSDACQALIALLDQFDRSTVSSVLGFKFRHYYDSTQGDDASAPPESLYKVTALLIKAECCSLEKISAYVSHSPLVDLIVIVEPKNASSLKPLSPIYQRLPRQFTTRIAKLQILSRQ